MTGDLREVIAGGLKVEGAGLPGVFVIGAAIALVVDIIAKLGLAAGEDMGTDVEDLGGVLRIATGAVLVGITAGARAAGSR